MVRLLVFLTISAALLYAILLVISISGSQFKSAMEYYDCYFVIADSSNPVKVVAEVWVDEHWAGGNEAIEIAYHLTELPVEKAWNNLTFVKDSTTAMTNEIYFHQLNSWLKRPKPDEKQNLLFLQSDSLFQGTLGDPSFLEIVERIVLINPSAHFF
jgi:hypothetical protein